MGFWSTALPVAGAIGGSFFGPAGTIAGGALGSMAGGLVDPVEENIQQAPVVDQSIAAPSSSQQQFMDYLSKNVYGTSNLPSVSQALLEQKTRENQLATSGQLASIRGVQDPSIISKAIAQSGANIGQQAIGQGSILRAQEAQNAAELKAARETQFLAALEADRAAKLGLSKINADVGMQNTKSYNEAASAQDKSQKEFISGLGQAGATLYGARDKTKPNSSMFKWD